MRGVHDVVVRNNKVQIKLTVSRNPVSYTHLDVYKRQVFARLAFFQEFEMIAVYYDNGQSAVSIARHDALDYVRAKNVADYRDADPNARRLLQVCLLYTSRCV